MTKAEEERAIEHFSEKGFLLLSPEEVQGMITMAKLMKDIRSDLEKATGLVTGQDIES